MDGNLATSSGGDARDVLQRARDWAPRDMNAIGTASQDMSPCGTRRHVFVLEETVVVSTQKDMSVRDKARRALLCQVSW